jgi:CheY-like chemotaxis protein/anti-sigma regulatory factor (Ser/Thr protein kinase)
LLVEDTPAALKLLSMMVGSMGWEFDTAVDGEQALEIIKSKPPEFYSIIISDWLMPKMDGLQLLKKLKSDAARRHIPVILQTALADRASMQQGLNEGAFYYLTKPLDMDLVQSVIRSALKDARVHTSLRAELNKVTGSFSAVEKAIFKFKTVEQAQGLAMLIASLAEEPEDAVVGLFELMINAVEHGNLGITYDEKTELINQQSLSEEVQRRLEMPEYADKYVTVELNSAPREVHVAITDMGSGFDFEKFFEFSLERALDNHGRGIMMANNSGFSTLRYEQGGRQAICIMPKSISG